jgi:hypothetical protein
MQTFTNFLLGDDIDSQVNEAKTTFYIPLKWDNEKATVGFEPEANTDNYKISIHTQAGFASYYVDVENDGDITNIKGANVLASMLNNFILLDKKKQKK